MNRISEKIEELKKEGLFRRLKTAVKTSSARVDFGSGELINFSTNDYLGLSGNKRVIERAKQFADQYGAGARASRLIAGTTKAHTDLEVEIAGFKKTDAAVVFPSGYMANLGLINSLVQKDDVLIIDRLNHASIIDACRMNPARLFVYHHKDTEMLEKILKRCGRYRSRFIITDTIFSMDGDMAPLKGVAELADKYDAYIIADEAHASGIFGADGTGICEYLEVGGGRVFAMGTLSKAIGSQGGFVAGPEELADYLINSARPFIYTTGLAPACCGAAIESLRIIKENSKPRENLLKNAGYLREKLKKIGFDTLDSCSQIIPVLTKDLSLTVGLSAKLFEKGVYVPPIRPPTVPEGMCRLRISLSAEHSLEDIDYLLGCLSAC